MNEWSAESFCADQRQVFFSDEVQHSENTRAFLETLGLSFIHPLCESNSTISWSQEVPSIGPAQVDYFRLHDGSWTEMLITTYQMFVPASFSLFSLWCLLFSAVMAPLGCLFLIKYSYQKGMTTTTMPDKTAQIKTSASHEGSLRSISLACMLTVASSLVIMTDALYIHDMGSNFGTTLFMVSSMLSLRICRQCKLNLSWEQLIFLILLTASPLFWSAEEQQFTLVSSSQAEQPTFNEGLYYNTHNPFINCLVSLWDPSTRNYSPRNGATSWMVTGDVTTGLPFFLNTVDYDPNWIRVWLPTTTSVDKEVLALDIAFPSTGHDFEKPVYLVLHGLNGGSSEGYVKDLVMRRNLQGSTVVVMIARGMLDTPIRTWNFFHGARVSDVHDAATAVKTAVGPHQVLVGVGYSMGAIVLNSYVATSGISCALDAAFSISGALDCRYELNDTRSKHLWQPLLADSMKSQSLLGKHGKKVRARLTDYEMRQLMRASSVVEVDRWVAVAYHGFNTLEDYYAAMSALGDISQDDYFKNTSMVVGKIHNISIPLCIMHALDDPISTWRTVASNEGFMQPANLIRTGRGNLMLLFTKKGGHVGWPLGWLSHRRQWEFMSEAAAHFADAVMKAKQEMQRGECSTTRYS